MKKEIKIIPPDFASEEDVKKFVEDCDRSFDREIDRVVEKIIEHGDVRVIKLAGPSCAGKTTASGKIIRALEKKNIPSSLVSIDSFFYDREYLHRMSREKGDGELDYDSPDTIDFELFEKFINDILQRGEAECPVFDFTLGRATSTEKLTLSENGILLVEGIQAFYRQVSDILKCYRSVSVYISALSSLSHAGTVFDETEIRLMRRIVRDSRSRATSPEKTFELWRSVRRNEEKNIFPFIDTADIRIDSSMLYELGMLKPYLSDILGGIEDSRATDILEKLRSVREISSEYIGEDSLYTEFI